MYLIIPFFLHKMLAPHRQPTFRDSRWTKYSNPGQLYPPRPPNFKVVFFFQGLRRVDKTNQTPQHDRSCTCSLTLKFGEGGVVQSFPRGVNILSIYGMQIIVNHFKHDKGFKFKWIQPSFDCSWWVVQHVVLEIVLKDPVGPWPSWPAWAICTQDIDLWCNLHQLTTQPLKE